MSETPYSRPPPEYATAASSSSSKKPTAPVYGATDGSNDLRKPLLQPQSGEGFAPRDAWNEDGEAEEDFLIGVTLSQSSQQVRHDFVRKVYTVLFCQILLTTLIGAVMCTDKVAVWTFQHQGWLLGMVGLTVLSMIGTFLKATSSPLNVIFLGLFTVCEAVTIGWTMPMYDPETILKALILTTFVFLGLTLFTFQTKYDVSSWYPFLAVTLIVFCFITAAQIFFPFPSGFELALGVIGCLLFSAYIIFDTHLLLHRLHPDQWVLAAVSLYLDFLNLFLQILRVISDIQDR